MKEEIVYYGHNDGLMEVVKNAIMLVPPEIGPHINGFRIGLGVHHDNNGQHMRFWRELPEKVVEESRQWNPFFTSFRHKYHLQAYLNFKSESFLTNPLDISRFLYEWEEAFRKWGADQHETVQQLTIMHAVGEVICIKEHDGTIRVRMEFYIGKKKSPPSLFSLKVEN